MSEYVKIRFEDHDFEKENLVTTSNGLDWYVCKKCGLKAWRTGLRNYLEAYSDPGPCKCHETVTGSSTIGKHVIIKSRYAQVQFGFEPDKVYTSCEGTDPKYANDIWVYSEARKEPVRLLPQEYYFVD